MVIATWTKEALLTLRTSTEKMIGKGRKYIAFIDVENTFDTANWRKIFQILCYIRQQGKEQQNIYDFYKNQSAIMEYTVMLERNINWTSGEIQMHLVPSTPQYTSPIFHK